MDTEHQDAQPAQEPEMNSEHEFRFVAGALVRRHVRQILESEVFSGRSIRWMEQKNWIESVFLVRGESDDAKSVESRLEHYAKCLNR